MKSLSLKPLIAGLFLALGLPLSVHSTELIQNGNFSAGTDSWHGDVTDSTSPDSLGAPSTTGFTLPLSSDHWTKIYQDFNSSPGQLQVTVMYKYSPDTTFSTNKDDYHNVSGSIGYNAWKRFGIPVGNWCLFLSDFGPDKGKYFKIHSKVGSDQVQGFTAHSVERDSERKTITLAFPPGQGSVTILLVSATNS